MGFDDTGAAHHLHYGQSIKASVDLDRSTPGKTSYTKQASEPNGTYLTPSSRRRPGSIAIGRTSSLDSAIRRIGLHRNNEKSDFLHLGLKYVPLRLVLGFDGKQLNCFRLPAYRRFPNDL